MEVSSRSRLRKYISDARRNETIKIMLIMSKKVNIKMKITAGNDPKDFYLLSLAKQIKAEQWKTLSIARGKSSEFKP